MHKEVSILVDVPKLRGAIAEAGYSQAAVARALGITPQGFVKKMQRCDFKTSEAEQMIQLLDIKDPIAIFFPALRT